MGTRDNLRTDARCLAAGITVPLGLKEVPELTARFQSIALISGALITVLNAVEAFYDYHSLWIRRTVTLARLHLLRMDLNFSFSGAENSEVDIAKREEVASRYQNILEDDLKDWLKLREATLTRPEPEKPTGTDSTNS